MSNKTMKTYTKTTVREVPMLVIEHDDNANAMTRRTFNMLYDVRNILITLFIHDKNKATRKEVNRLIKSLTRILDKEINKNYADVQAMRRSQRCARDKKDYEAVDIRQARLDIAQKQLEVAQDKISKIHLHAKYTKVWL